MSNDIVSSFLCKVAEETKHQVKQIIQNAKFDRTVKGRVIDDLGKGKYTVEIDGRKYTSSAEHALVVGDLVYVTVISNNYNNLLARNIYKGNT